MFSSAETLVQAKWEDAFKQLSGNRGGASGLLSFVEAWDVAVSVLRPRPLGETIPTPAAAEASASFELIHAAKMTQSLIDHFVRDLEDSRHYLEAEVQRGMSHYEATGDMNDFTLLIDRLSEWYSHWYPNPQSSTLLKAYKMTFHTLVSSVLPPSFSEAFALLLKDSMTYASEVNTRLFQKLELLGLLDRYESLLSGVVYRQIEAKVNEMCPKEWYTPQLGTLRTWLRENVVPWLAAPYARGAKNAEEARVMVSGIVSRFDFYVCRTLCDLRITEIFDIIVDFPDSIEALNDLKVSDPINWKYKPSGLLMSHQECLGRVDRRVELVQSVRNANSKRLLHPGADTKDILNQYVSTIKCLKVIDPPGVLLHKVADPVRKYLRERPDTIRSIVSSLVGEGGDLVEETEQIAPTQSTVEDYSDRNWEPEPIDAESDFRTSKQSDVVSTLVSIYDSKDLFVKELQHLLAQRLLSIKDGNFDKERRNVEILKLRFGEAALQVCEVMLKDMTDSRRLDLYMQAQEATALRSTVISRHFWPPLQPSKLKMPGQFQSIQSNYDKSFNSFKPDKRLRWIAHLGEVELEIELQDRTISASVNPLQAAVIEAFSAKEEMTVQEVSSTLGGVELNQIRKAVAVWMDYGILQDLSNGRYGVVERGTAQGTAPRRDVAPQTVIADIQSIVSVEQEDAKKMQVYWMYIKGILTNLGQQPVQKIQDMLKLAPGYDRTVDQLGAFLEAARREGLVIVNDSLWKLNTT